MRLGVSDAAKKSVANTSPAPERLRQDRTGWPSLTPSHLSPSRAGAPIATPECSSRCSEAAASLLRWHQSRMASERPKRSANRDHDREGDDGVHDSDHDDVAVAFAVSQAADREQAYNCAVMGQDVQGAGA